MRTLTNLVYLLPKPFQRLKRVRRAWRPVCSIGVGLLIILAIESTICFGQTAANSRYDLLVDENDVNPGGTDTFTGFSDVVMSDGGQWVGFAADISGAVNRGIFRYSASNNSVDRIIANGDALSGGNFTMSTGGLSLSTNNNGTVAFIGRLTGTGGTDDDTGIYSGSGGAIDELVREGNATPAGGGTFENFGTGFLDVQFRGINNLGETIFHDSISDSSAGFANDNQVFRVGPNAPESLAIEGGPAPVGGDFLIFSHAAMNNVGQAVTAGSVANANLGNKFWYVESNGDLSEIVSSLVTGGTPTSVGQIRGLAGNAAINNQGNVAFVGWTTSSGSESHIFKYDKTADSLSVAFSAGGATPDGNGIFDTIIGLQPRYNDASQYALGFDLDQTSGGATDDSGIFRLDTDGTMAQLFREGQSAVDGNGTLGAMNGAFSFAFNNAGNAAMITNLVGTTGGLSDNQVIMITDGIDTIQVARDGELVDGKTVLGIGFSNSVYGNDRSTSGLNDFGQIAFEQSLSGGGNSNSIQLWTPELHHRGGDSDFSDSSKWTLSIGPAYVHDVFIDSATDSTVTLSGTQAVRSLEIGGGGLANLQFGDNAILDVEESLLLASNGSISLGENSSMAIGSLAGSGTINGPASSTIFVEDLLTPGNSAGQLEISGALELGSAATTLIELGGVAPGEFDQIFGLSGLTIDGDLSVELINGFTLADGMEFEILSVLGSSSGEFDGLNEGDLVGSFGGEDLFISYAGGSGNSVSLFTFSAVPEPSSLLFVSLIFGGVAMRRRRSADSI